MFERFFERVLRESAEDVLEKMFFIRDVGEPALAGGGYGPEVAAHLTFEGTPPGWLTLRASKTAARSIAADFLGEEEETVTDQQAEDMVCELANMICGSALSRTGSDATFRISSPLIVGPEDSIDGSPDLRDAAIHRVALGNGMLTILMKAEATPCLTPQEFAF
jgi:CheY-specific phosphatase CheX